MTISSTNINHLNKMNKAAKDSALGTVIAALQNGAVTAGSTVATSTHSNGSAISLSTGLTSVKGKIVEVRRSGSLMTGGSGAGIYAIASGGSLVVANGGDYKVTIGDTVSWIAW